MASGTTVGESAETRQLLAEMLTSQPLSADLQISAFSAAVHHYRRASVATPFPSHLFTTAKGEKDYRACQSALTRLPSVHSLATEQLAKLSPQTLDLLTWLLLPENRRKNSFVPVDRQVFMQQVTSKTCTGSSPPNFANQQEAPTSILEIQRDPISDTGPGSATTTTNNTAYSRPVLAYHGTCMENLHSILNTGLLNLSGTRMGRNGAIFGNGIYLSTRFDVAFSFSQPADTWSHSQLGGRARCLLVCEVDMSKVVGSSVQGSGSVPQSGPSSSAPSASGTDSGGGSLPDSYILVNRADAVRLQYVLIYHDSNPGAIASGLGQVPWSKVVVLAYVMWILMQWFMRNRQLQLQLKRWWDRLGTGGADAHLPAWQRWQ